MELVFIVKEHKIIRIPKNLKTLKDHKEKMSIHVSIHMSKILHMPIKVDVHMYATYANCQTLNTLQSKTFAIWQCELHPHEILLMHFTTCVLSA